MSLENSVVTLRPGRGEGWAMLELIQVDLGYFYFLLYSFIFSLVLSYFIIQT